MQDMVRDIIPENFTMDSQPLYGEIVMWAHFFGPPGQVHWDCVIRFCLFHGAIAVVLASIAAYTAWWDKHRAPRHYFPQCTGKLWRRRYRWAVKQRIRELLRVFFDDEGMASQRLCFGPEEAIAAIADKHFADAMAVEDLFLRIEERYGLSLANDISNTQLQTMTLGELFELTQTSRIHYPPARRSAPSSSFSLPSPAP
ncbi:hypothetical protein DB346_18630 [Verrucomicrobia bacterium LW23]|nr:hypothetical protein DB346_18630 [Verrucomicrobia bacterium LW23]